MRWGGLLSQLPGSDAVAIKDAIITAGHRLSSERVLSWFVLLLSPLCSAVQYATQGERREVVGVR